MNVLSLFDGMSCAQIALQRLGIPVDQYYASEIDKYAMQVTQKNFPATQQMGDITKWRSWNIDWASIDLVCAGSPCQGFSFAGKQLAFEDPRSRLFFVFVDILRHIQALNPDVKFLLENVKMKKEYLAVITECMGVQPVFINSALVSAQNRQRYYWTNLGAIEQPNDKSVYLIDILELNVPDRFYHSAAAINYLNRSVKDGRTHWDFSHHSDSSKEKSVCLTSAFSKGVPYNVLIDRRKVNQLNPFSGCRTNQPRMQHRIYSSRGKSAALTQLSRELSVYPDKAGLIRKLTPIECERLQTVPDNYTDCVSNTQRYRMLGNGWTVDVICHILQHLKPSISIHLDFTL